MTESFERNEPYQPQPVAETGSSSLESQASQAIMATLKENMSLLKVVIPELLYDQLEVMKTALKACRGDPEAISQINAQREIYIQALGLNEEEAMAFREALDKGRPIMSLSFFTAVLKAANPINQLRGQRNMLIARNSNLSKMVDFVAEQMLLTGAVELTPFAVEQLAKIVPHPAAQLLAPLIGEYLQSKLKKLQEERRAEGLPEFEALSQEGKAQVLRQVTDPAMEHFASLVEQSLSEGSSIPQAANDNLPSENGVDGVAEEAA